MPRQDSTSLASPEKPRPFYPPICGYAGHRPRTARWPRARLKGRRLSCPVSSSHAGHLRHRPVGGCPCRGQVMPTSRNQGTSRFHLHAAVRCQCQRQCQLLPCRFAPPSGIQSRGLLVREEQRRKRGLQAPQLSKLKDASICSIILVLPVDWLPFTTSESLSNHEV